MGLEGPNRKSLLKERITDESGHGRKKGGGGGIISEEQGAKKITF